MSRGQPSIEVAIDPEIAMGSIEVAKALCPGDVIQAKSFCAKQLLVVSTETGSGIVNGQDVGCVRVFVKAAAAKDQRALSELSPGYFEAGQHTVNLLRKAVRVAAPNVAAPAAAAPAVEAPAVEAPAEGPSEAAVEKTRSLAARSAALVARSAVIPVGTVVVLIMGAEVPQPVHAIKVSESGEDSWKVLGPTAGGWLHPHHNLGIGDQTHAASLPIYSFAEPPTHTAEAAGAEATGAKSASPDPGAVSLAMKTPLFTFMRRNASASNERLHFGPCPNTAFASQTDSTTNTVNIPKALRSTFSHTSTSAACVGSPLRSAKGTVILEAAARFDLPASQSTFFSPTDDLRSFVRLDLKLCMLPQVDQVQFFLAVAHFDAKALAFQSYDGTGARGTSNFVIENTFRYLHDKTLVVVLGLLLPSTIEAPVLPFDANRLIAVAEKRCGVWCGFCVGGLSLVPVGEEKGRGLAPSQEILPLEAKDEAAVLRAGAALLSGSKPLDDSIVIFCPPGAASSRLPFSGKSKLGRRKHALVHDPPAARQTTVRPLPANPPGRKNGEDGSSSGGIIGGGADSKRWRAPDVPRTQPPKKAARS